MAPALYIDLTNDDDDDGPPIVRPTVPAKRPANTSSFAAPAAQRIKTSSQSTLPRVNRFTRPKAPKRASLRDCLEQQIVPFVVLKIHKIELSEGDKDELAESVITGVARLPHFRKRLDETGGKLSPKDVLDFQAEINGLLTQKLRQYPLRQARSLPQWPRRPADPDTSSEDSLQPSGSEPPIEQPPRHIPPRTRLRWPGLDPLELPPRRVRKETQPFQPLVRPPRLPQSVSHPLAWGLRKRPYRSAREREDIRRGLRLRERNLIGLNLNEPYIYHVDFSADEIAELVKIFNRRLRGSNVRSGSRGVQPTLEGLVGLIQGAEDTVSIPTFIGNGLKGRGIDDIHNFCADLKRNDVPSQPPRVLSLSQHGPEHPQDMACARQSSLLLARELEGYRGFSRMRAHINLKKEFELAAEDGLDLISEYTNCAGDVMTISWTLEHSLLCGTTTHSDSHNQQYNKQGNLLLCSTQQGTLQAYPEHRIPRPAGNKENNTEAMRQSQDPWVYPSVASSDYDPIGNLLYTSSYDHTVKVWKVHHTWVEQEQDVDNEASGHWESRMEHLATWQHQGNVNFVVAAKDGSGRVASAADVPTEAVRIYTINENDLANSPYQSLSCTRTDANDTEKWAYYPATMQWGKSPYTQHLLAVGYSPRSPVGEDLDIPEDKRDSGEVTIWDANQHRRVNITNATTANVFEIVWHPDLPQFVCATSPCGLNVRTGVKTQLHIFQNDKALELTFCEFVSLDCPAADINEVTFQPNSRKHAYVTAACTNRKVYVWDTAHPDTIQHVLYHGLSKEFFEEDPRDTGVKFTAWGSLDRLYTGSSDGVVKVWNVRDSNPFVRKLLETAAPVSCGAFSPDKQKLAIGDATGRLWLYSTDRRDEVERHYTTIGGRNIRRPMPFRPHAEPPPPEPTPGTESPGSMDIDTPSVEETSEGLGEGQLRGQALLKARQIANTGNPVIGCVQGPAYETTGYFKKEAHLDGDCTKPLLPEIQRQQQLDKMDRPSSRNRSLLRLSGMPPPESPAAARRHEQNQKKDLDEDSLEISLRVELAKLKVSFVEDYDDLPYESASEES
ncbi:Rik1-associated factor-like protein [Emericellopsis cladophorae]|uniref:Rik1-associated factor-like protein n=1 Tax=Emericellopsis cladophorae TaxID=2686198 RepID=A0A9P9XZP8_9HYPO|nr:Rik1-associated factor-like protein [Emericellopsis cladophorae]KAI6780898.1 Rik1-associated factor-like protein [Emericellopsis cladophorae]